MSRVLSGLGITWVRISERDHVGWQAEAILADRCWPQASVAGSAGSRPVARSGRKRIQRVVMHKYEREREREGWKWNEREKLAANGGAL